MKNIYPIIILLVVTSFLITSCSTNRIAQERSLASDDEFQPRSAYDIYSDLVLNGITFDAVASPIDTVDFETGEPIKGLVTYGGEKEGSSSLITRVMGPHKKKFQSLLGDLKPNDRKLFITDFLSNWAKESNGYRTYLDESGKKIDLSVVAGIDGNTYSIDPQPFKSFNYANASLEELEDLFDSWISQTHNRPFSFIAPETRAKLFKGKIPGISKENFTKYGRNRFGDWIPNFGESQKFIEGAHNTGVQNGKGWELNFVPQKTYGEYEEMIYWFKHALSVQRSDGKVVLFEAPGHQRMVFPANPNLDKGKLADFYRAIQAYIVTEGIKGKTGIERARHKNVIEDYYMERLESERGVIRLEGDRFGRQDIAGEGSAYSAYKRALPYKSMAIEFRAGTKDVRVQRFVQTALAARISSNDFSGISKIESYSLIGQNNLTTEALEENFGVTHDQAVKFLTVVRTAESGMMGRTVFSHYVVPIWNWTGKDNPIVSPKKKKLLRRLGQTFIMDVINLGVDASPSEITEYVRGWITASNISEDLQKYISTDGMSKITDTYHHFIPTRQASVANLVDVNQIDLGIEYSARMPLRAVGEMSATPLADQKKHMVGLRSDLTYRERRLTLRNVAFDLSVFLANAHRPKLVKDANEHGHGLDVAYVVKDKKGRDWRVEWDGIGRVYSPEGELAPQSGRGGSIEIPTPKFNPEISEIEAVYRAFEKNGVIPNVKTGGGHINIDLAAFAGKPREFARFISIFLQYRGIIAQMFQHPMRLKAALPINIDPELARSLANFNGTEDELKKMLYDKKYFNDHIGRKTRYLQLDVSSYFQDVIPPEYVTSDFDIGNPAEYWRKQFRVDPKIRKAEFRLFNAPKDAYESALQIRLVRAILNKALNESAELPGTVQNVSHEEYLNNPKKALNDLKALGDDLDLDITEYKRMVSQGLGLTQLFVNSKFYTPLKNKMAFFKKAKKWLPAVESRSASNAINSEGRTWSGTPDEETLKYSALRVQAMREEIEDRRASKLMSKFRRPAIKNCNDAVNIFLGI